MEDGGTSEVDVPATFRSRPSQRTRFTSAFIAGPAAASRSNRPEQLYTCTVTGEGRPRVTLMPTSRLAKAPVGENTLGANGRPARVPLPVITLDSAKSAYRPAA